MNIAGIVLAGGKSSRYGKPKMFELHQGIPFYLYSVNAFKNAGLDAIFISTNQQLASQFDQEAGSILLEDDEHNGPLFALSQAMKQLIDSEWFFILAADIPYVSVEFVNTMLEELKKNQPDIIIPVTDEYVQPLHSIYNRSCLPIIEELLHSNKKSFMPLLDRVSIQKIRFPSDQKDFVNINKREDWNNE